MNATHILDGSIRRAGAKVRIAAHLTETNSQTTVWSDKFDRSLDDIFAVQDEISEAIAKALNTAFLPRKTSAIDPIAYDLYLRAKSSSPDPAEAARNIATLETVTRLAPDFADGWASLAHARMATITLLPYAGRARHRALAEAELARCLALDPDSVMGADANWAMCDPFGDYLAQEKIMRRVSEIGTNSANAQFGLGIISKASEETVRRSKHRAACVISTPRTQSPTPFTFRACGELASSPKGARRWRFTCSSGLTIITRRHS
uniref:Uncharacterized protein n=1 Tax=Phenylobacterium glaciei TaxID=2803784 RepID=A0A974SBG1_9CAUL|nr:hypothetical protein JKL49_13210 [Phenylobacterium glaciei]